MLTIRLKRTGRKNQPSYRVIVTPKRAGGPEGKPVEYLGWLNPLKKKFALKKERIEHWLSQGAQPSATLHNLLVKAGIVKGSKIPKHHKAPVKEQSVPAEAAPVQEQAPKESVSEKAPEAAPQEEPAKQEPAAQEPSPAPGAGEAQQ